MDKKARFGYSYFRNKKNIILGGLLLTILQLMLFVIYKKQGGILVDTLTDARLFFGKLVLDRMVINCLAIGILAVLTLKCKNAIARFYPVSFREIARANLRYLWIILISLLLFIPISILIRHFIRNGFSFEAERLVRNFRNFGRLYVEDLIPFSIVGYLFFNGNIFSQRQNNMRSNGPITSDKGNQLIMNDDLIEVINDNGNIVIKVSDIFWIEKKDRAYAVKTEEGLYHIRKTIKDLERILEPKGFLRINRGVIVNKNFVKNYSFWEFDKFILRMTDTKNTEFIVSRDRMRQIKSQLA